MSFLTPTFLALAALAVPIILLYMLRLRRREVPVSSTMLWQRLMQDREANAPWQRLRRNLLLLLQLLMLQRMYHKSMLHLKAGLYPRKLFLLVLFHQGMLSCIVCNLHLHLHQIP